MADVGVQKAATGDPGRQAGFDVHRNAARVRCTHLLLLKGSGRSIGSTRPTSGKYVFSKLGRNVEAGKQDTHEADVFDPAPQSMPSKLLKSARELTHAGPMTWTDAAVGFFGYDPLAKALYRKLSGQFEEHIS